MNKNKTTVIISCVIVVFIAVIAVVFAFEKNGKDDTKETTTVETTAEMTTVKELVENQNFGEKTNAVISMDNIAEFQSSVETAIVPEEDLVKKTVEVDTALLNELSNSAYTIAEPLIVVNPYGYSPLSAQILFQSSKEGTIRVTVKGKKEANDITKTIDEKTTSHVVPVIGLYADYDNAVFIEVLDDNGNVIESNTCTIKTDILPEKLVDVVNVEQSNATACFELFLMTGDKTPYVYAFDGNGDIRWYLDWNFKSIGVYPLSNGHFLIESESVMVPTASKARSGLLYEIDYTGRIYNRYYIQNGAHHDLTEMDPDGNLLALSNSNEGFEMDMVEEYDRETGEIVRTLNLRDTFANCGLITRDDWAHLNTCSYDAKDDAVILSARNLHSVVKINWTTGKIMWILCDSRFWEGTEYEQYVLKPEGDVDYQFQQHGSYQIAEDLDGNPDTVELALFDNHNDKDVGVDYYDNNDYSYTTVYSIDEANNTVKMLRTYQGAYSNITSNFQYVPESNVMISVNANANSGDREARIYEFDYDTEEVINEYSLSHSSYRGYVMDIDLNSCVSEIDLNSNYAKGQLRGLTKVEKAIEIPETVVTDDIASASILDNVLLINTKNHSFSQIVFQGENNTYVFDITDIVMTEMVNYKFKVAIPMQQLVSDTYTVIGNFNGENQKLAQTITIK